MRSRSFPPLAAPDARLLILGALPGAQSLQRQEYYAHPRNAFWPIMQRLLGIDPALPFPVRAAALKAQRVALWDVCASATRPGSLDSDITEPEINDFAGFYKAHPHIRLVCFNGQIPQKLYRKLVLPHLPPLNLHYALLPSTSPALAGLSVEAKYLRWREALNDFITAQTTSEATA